MSKYPPQGEGWNAPGTCGGGYWRVVNGIYESWPPNPRNTVTLGAGLTMGIVAPSSPVETTGADLGTTSYTGVIRPADEAVRTNTYLHAIAYADLTRFTPLSHRRAIAAACMALADAEHVALTAEVENLNAAYGFLEVEVAEQIAKVAERNATIERLRGGREIEQTMLANVLPTLADNAAENEALRAEVASLRAFQLQHRRSL